MPWYRTCQECGLVGTYTKPNVLDPKERWRDTKCRKCKSEALDYGSNSDPRIEREDYTHGVTKEEVDAALAACPKYVLLDRTEMRACLTAALAVRGRDGGEFLPSEMTEVMMGAGQRYLDERSLGESYSLPVTFNWHEFWRAIIAASPSTKGDAMNEIAAERKRQIEIEGWTAEHDDTHSRGEMARAATAYAKGAAEMRERAADMLDEWSQNSRRIIRDAGTAQDLACLIRALELPKEGPR